MRKIVLISLLTLLSACAMQQQISYFQDVEPSVEAEYALRRDITSQRDDVISIVVSSKNPELAMLFNLPKVQQIAGSVTSTASAATSAELLGYTVNSRGCIDFPVIGEIYILGQTKEQIAATIKMALISNDLVKDPVVTVNFMNLTFSVMGEVSTPGRYSIEKSRTTILEALSMAGDLTIYGVRDKVYLTRDKDGVKITYKLDLRSQDIYNSPAYYVQQNDLIYVEPNKVRANQSTVNGNVVQSTSFWISLASLLTTISLLFVN